MLKIFLRSYFIPEIYLPANLSKLIQDRACVFFFALLWSVSLVPLQIECVAQRGDWMREIDCEIGWVEVEQSAGGERSKWANELSKECGCMSASNLLSSGFIIIVRKIPNHPSSRNLSNGRIISECSLWQPINFTLRSHLLKNHLRFIQINLIIVATLSIAHNTRINEEKKTSRED